MKKMKSKWRLFASIFQLVVGVMAILAFAILIANGEENMIKWTVTLILAIAFVVLGIVGIIDYRSNQ